jgi:hypothetical protein
MKFLWEGAIPRARRRRIFATLCPGCLFAVAFLQHGSSPNPLKLWGNLVQVCFWHFEAGKIILGQFGADFLQPTGCARMMSKCPAVPALSSKHRPSA